MIEFLTENWKLILTVGLIVVEMVLFLVFKKRPTFIDNSLFSKICRWIEQAEVIYGPGNGEKKLEYVMNQAHSDLGVYFEPSRVEEVIEWVLSLPQKKEK